MSRASHRPAPDQGQRELALDSARSCLVQAPAGSGKTTLLAERFLRLLCEVDEPGQVVAITFTNAAAAEMRHRILDELRKDDPGPTARRVLQHSSAMGWNLLDLPAQLRICTIDSFCRELALQQPLLSHLGGGLEISEQPQELYRLAARRTLQQIEGADDLLRQAMEELLLARDNNWQSMEELLIEMLAQRDRWMHDFVLEREPDWDVLRARLERPFQRAIESALNRLSGFLDHIPDMRGEMLALAHCACEEPGPNSPMSLAACTAIPCAPFLDQLEEAFEIHLAFASFLQTAENVWRSERGLKAADGFPSNDRGRAGKARFAEIIGRLSAVPGLQSAFSSLKELPLIRYSEQEWTAVRASFILLRRAAAELRVVFAETAAADFIEVAQTAQRVLRDDEGHPTEAALSTADRIRHLLVDEFQDTSRRQHQMLSSLIAAWPEPARRTCFAVGDPMQSIYFFRGADAELFPRVAHFGIEYPSVGPGPASTYDSFPLDLLVLSANFRTRPDLVTEHNRIFGQVFAQDDGSGIVFPHAEAAREERISARKSFNLHINFDLQNAEKTVKQNGTKAGGDSALARQTGEVVDLIAAHVPFIERARERGEKYRVAVLGRARTALAPIAQALHERSIPFRAVDLEPLANRPEVLDAISLSRALLNAFDRIAWLGVLRAPWCGLSIEDLHRIASADDPEVLARPIPELLMERSSLLGAESRRAIERVLRAMQSAPALRSEQPASSLGTWLQQVWRRLGGADCADAAARANLDLLWECIDALPGGEQDILGRALNAALTDLKALPDPAAGGECGVQLMTIHNSKGLEFEVVIVPDLQAGARRGERGMLTWLERGLAEPDGSGEVTEFLIAPLARRGARSGKAKAWVDAVYCERELQEMRRLLYVAATRAREELHFYARPACKRRSDGALHLLPPRNDSLLHTAWPALGTEIVARFENWKEQREPGELESVAAFGTENLVVLPSTAGSKRAAWLRRLPADYTPPDSDRASNPSAPALVGMAAARLYARHEGGLVSRALGRAVHALLEELARLRVRLDWPECRSSLPSAQPAIAAEIRGLGMTPAQAAALAAQAHQIVLAASADPTCQWILSPHPEAASEIAWAGVVSDTLRTVRVDRVFRAGVAPGSWGEECWWIIDYKTAHADSIDPSAALPQFRSLFAPQLEAYAAVLRKLHGADVRIRAGLYYPRMSVFDSWEPVALET